MLSTMRRKLCSLSRTLSEEYISLNRRQVILSGEAGRSKSSGGKRNGPKATEGHPSNTICWSKMRLGKCWNYFRQNLNEGTGVAERFLVARSGKVTCLL